MIPPETQLRPRTVTLAVWLLSISAAIEALFVGAGLAGLLPFLVLGSSIIGSAVTTLLIVLCAISIRAGRNWSRWLMLVVSLPAVLLFPISIFRNQQALDYLPVILVAEGTIQFVLQLAALTFIFAPVSRGWFRPTEMISE